MYRQCPRTPPVIARQIRQTLANTYSRPLALGSQIRLQTTTTDRVSKTSPTMAADAADRVSNRIKQDHRELEDYYKKIKSSQRDDDRVRWQNQFVWELARHSIAEELVVYPAFEKYIPDGMKKAEKDRSEHQMVKEKLYEFQSMSPSEPTFDPAIDSLWETLAQHIREEETDDLPALEKAIDSDVSGSLARSFGRTKHFVPTRSHPGAPDRPPYETAVGMMTTPIDKLMDMFRKFPEDTGSGAAGSA